MHVFKGFLINTTHNSITLSIEDSASIGIYNYLHSKNVELNTQDSRPFQWWISGY